MFFDTSLCTNSVFPRLSSCVWYSFRTLLDMEFRGRLLGYSFDLKHASTDTGLRAWGLDTTVLPWLRVDIVLEFGMEYG